MLHKFFVRAVAVVLPTCVAGCSSESSSVPLPQCPAGESCLAFAHDATEQQIADAFATAKNGQTLLFGQGTFAFTNTLVVAANGIKVRGSGVGNTILDFNGQTSGSEGLFAQNVTDITFSEFTIRNTAGNGIKVLGSTGVTMSHVIATWTEQDKHGPYGLYPVGSKNILVENCKVSGASDAGIYLGQSDHAVLRSNEVHDNVAGIEVENTFFADVYDNEAHDNTGGVLVFDLPGLQQLGGHDVRIYNNNIHDNNTKNFAPEGNIVGLVPRGTGFFAMANSRVEVFGNDFENNLTVHAAVISYFVAGKEITDPNYYPYPSKVFIHDNVFGPGGSAPDASKQIGILLTTALGSFPNNVVPPVVYDGIVDPKIKLPADNPMQLCLQGVPAFANLHLDQLDQQNPDLPAIMSLDQVPYDCALPAIDPVSFPGLQ